MPSISELERNHQERLASQLHCATERRRPMTGYEGLSDERLIDTIFDPHHPTDNNYQLRRELKYRLIERSQPSSFNPRVMTIIDNGHGEDALTTGGAV